MTLLVTNKFNNFWLCIKKYLHVCVKDEILVFLTVSHIPILLVRFLTSKQSQIAQVAHTDNDSGDALKMSYWT